MQLPPFKQESDAQKFAVDVVNNFVLVLRVVVGAVERAFVLSLFVDVCVVVGIIDEGLLELRVVVGAVDNLLNVALLLFMS